MADPHLCSAALLYNKYSLQIFYKVC